MQHLFVYGTLVSEDLMREITGKRFRRKKAVLYHFSRRRIGGTPYPAIVYDKGSMVEGIIYFDIDARSLALTDDYEDDYYMRTKVTVTADDGRVYEACTYVIRDEFRGLLSEQEWEVEF
jgi:gamma-glutamylcyclotransferase (GGCT)/AIG2-like uncharacterized protein YtfP